MTAPNPPGPAEPDELARARQRLRVMVAGPERDAAQLVLAELDAAQARARELDTAEAEAELRRAVRDDRSRHGRAISLVLAELDRARGTAPIAPVRTVLPPVRRPRQPARPAVVGDQPVPIRDGAPR